MSPDVLRFQYNARTGCGGTYGDGELKGPGSRSCWSSKKLGTSGKDSGCWFGGSSCVAEGATVLGADAVAGAVAGAVVAWPADGRPCRGWRGRCIPCRCEGNMPVDGSAGEYRKLQVDESKATKDNGICNSLREP